MEVDVGDDVPGWAVAAVAVAAEKGGVELKQSSVKADAILTPATTFGSLTLRLPDGGTLWRLESIVSYLSSSSPMCPSVQEWLQHFSNALQSSVRQKRLDVLPGILCSY